MNRSKLYISSLIVGGLMIFAGRVQARSAFNGAFVFPRVIFDREEYLLVGREAGGRDAGTYCIPGGSSGFWMFRDKDPLETATKEFMQEALIGWSYKETHDYLSGYADSLQMQRHGHKTIAVYSVPFEWSVINDILQNYYARRDSYYFWQRSYREMDRIGLVRLRDLKTLVRHRGSKHGLKIRALVIDPKTLKREKEMVTIRPILARMVEQVIG